MTDASKVGTLAWARRSRGALRRRDQLLLARQAAIAQLAALPRAARKSLLGDRGGRSALAAAAAPPDSRLTREAFELASEASTPAMLGHSLRCWLWGDLFAQLDDVDHDPEALYIASLLHDIALTEAHRPRSTDGVACFAVHGAEVARSVLADRGAEEALVRDVAEAICLHMNVEVPRAFGAEAHLLHAAAQLDVAGVRARELQRAAVTEVLAAHPRDGFPDEFGQLMRREEGERPRSRAALLWRLGMKRPLTHNPLDASSP